jgi:hypothetical protein
MSPEEKLIASINKAVKDLWHYDGVECPAIIKAIKEYESAQNQWSPPWPLKIPDWPEVWFAVDKTGSGNFYNNEPLLETGVHEWVPMGGTRLAECGLFEIQPGANWRAMKVRIR